MAGWVQIHDLVSLELFGHLCADPKTGNAEALFETEIKAMAVQAVRGNNKRRGDDDSDEI